MRITVAGIIAIAKNGVIGLNNALPWSIPNDLQLFKKITLGHPVVMGRRTFESIGKPLPGRQNIILTRDKNYKADGVYVINHPNDLYKLNLQDDKVFVIGGKEVYESFYPAISEWYVSRMHHEYNGDKFFDQDFDKWADKQELIHCDDDFTMTRYVKNHNYFDFELVTHSLTYEEERLVRYKDQMGIKNFPDLIKEEIIEGQSYRIHINLYSNGNILFKAVPYAHLDRSQLAIIHEQRFYDIVRPKKIMGYSEEEVLNAYNNIVQYARNLFTVVHGDLETLTIDKRLSDCMWEFMLKQVNTLPKSFAWCYKSHGAEDYVNYRDRLYFAETVLEGNADLLRPDHFQDDYLYETFIQIWEAMVIDAIYTIAHKFISDKNLWGEYNISKKNYKSLSAIKTMNKRYLFKVWNICKFILAALTYRTKIDLSNWREYFEKVQLIERVIAKLFAFYHEQRIKSEQA